MKQKTKEQLKSLSKADVKFSTMRWVIFIGLVVIGGLIGMRFTENPLVGGGIGGGVIGTIVYAYFYRQDKK